METTLKIIQWVESEIYICAERVVRKRGFGLKLGSKVTLLGIKSLLTGIKFQLTGIKCLLTGIKNLLTGI